MNNELFKQARLIYQEAAPDRPRVVSESGDAVRDPKTERAELRDEANKITLKDFAIPREKASQFSKQTGIFRPGDEVVIDDKRPVKVVKENIRGKDVDVKYFYVEGLHQWPGKRKPGQPLFAKFSGYVPEYELKKEEKLPSPRTLSAAEMNALLSGTGRDEQPVHIRSGSGFPESPRVPSIPVAQVDRGPDEIERFAAERTDSTLRILPNALKDFKVSVGKAGTADEAEQGALKTLKAELARICGGDASVMPDNNYKRILNYDAPHQNDDGTYGIDIKVPDNKRKPLIEAFYIYMELERKKR